MPYTTYAQINSLDEFSFIGGTDQTLEFTVYDQNGIAANLAAATCSWKLAPYGEPESTTLTKSGSVIATNIFQVYIPASDTLALEGKFMHQPIIILAGNEYRSQQGIINISAAIS